MDWGEVNPTHAYYNGSRTSKDNEDPSWNTSFKTRRTQKTTSAVEALWKTILRCYLYLLGTFPVGLVQDSDEEEDDQELEAHYVYMAKIQEVITAVDADNGSIFDKEPLENDDSNITLDLLDTAQEKERDLLASLIENIKIEIDKEADIEIARAYGLVKEQKDKLDKYCFEEAFQVFDIKQKFSELEKQLLAHKNTISTSQYEKEEQKKFYKTRIKALNKGIEACLKIIKDRSWTVLVDQDVKGVIEIQLHSAVDNTVIDVVEVKQTLKEEMVQDLRYFNSLE
ncbi:hypothetical protein Tco_1476469 [Tanacetum coccineum]